MEQIKSDLSELYKRAAEAPNREELQQVLDEITAYLTLTKQRYEEGKKKAQSKSVGK